MGMEVKVIDLALVSELRYRSATRRLRWLAGIGSPVVAAAVVYRAILTPPSGLFVLALGAAAFLSAFAAWMALFVLAPGPVTLVLEPTILSFQFAGGKELVFDPKQVSDDLEFQCRATMPATKPPSSNSEPDFFVRRGMTLYALTEEAFGAVTSWMKGAGFEKQEKHGGLAGSGWTEVSYRPRSNSAP